MLSLVEKGEISLLHDSLFINDYRDTATNAANKTIAQWQAASEYDYDFTFTGDSQGKIWV